jgi:thioredoxin-related protein
MKYFFSFLLIGCFYTVWSQEGISFESGDWKAVLSKAKAENKLVFIDVYTSWCGPCKKMAAEVFPKKEVADVFNASFVNYKIDAEKGEGVQIAKTFSVHAYPTYLFVNGDGQLVYRLTGYNEPKPFLAHAAIALKEKDDPKPLVMWSKEYESGNRDKQFLAGFLKKRATLKMPSAEIIEDITPLCSPEDLKNKEFLSAILYSDENIEYVPNGKFFSYVTAHYRELDSLLGKSAGYSLRLMENGIRSYFNKNIVANSKENMLPVIIDAGQKLSRLLNEKDVKATSRRWSLNYYNKTKNEKKLIPAAINYVNNGLMKLDIAGMIAADEADYKKFMEPYLSGQKDSTQVENWEFMKMLRKHIRMVNISYQLRDAAEAVYYNTKNVRYLSMAAHWAERAQGYFSHFSTKAVYAGLLYKAGEKQKGIQLMSEACNDNIVKSNPGFQNLLLSNVDKMKNSIDPENLWSLQLRQ